MEPVTLIVTAVALGAAAGLKPTVEQAVKDAYAGIKTLILRKYGAVGLEAVEKKPDSKPKQESLAEDLQEAGAAQDTELLAQAQALIDAVEQSKIGAEAAVAIGVDLKKVKAAALRIADVTASGTGVKVEEGEFTGDVDIRGVRAGVDRPPDPKA
ncbi:MAG: hypothetical protein DCC57_08160 [Chloroflexi bacterium]|nr:MAG: hypothetical protein DCC57_08160 [Chloroflexota bacterium]